MTENTMQYQIQQTGLNPYGELMASFIAQNFPQFTPKNAGELLDMLTDAILASGQIRFGPKPTPESIVAMRQIIRAKMETNSPIPFVVPWGSEKPDGSGPDLAEFMSLKTIQCLRDRISAHYMPGAEFSIRVEDLSAPYQFFYRADDARREAQNYTHGLQSLIQAVSMEHFVFTAPESGYDVSENQMNNLAESYRKIIIEHLLNPADSQAWAALNATGWDSPISAETVRYYLDSYIKLHPGMNEREHFDMLARYFALALARVKLGMNAMRPQWNGKALELYFGKPVPGVAVERYPRRMHYRTIPESITSNHMPPWRAKGYFEVTNDKLRVRLASMNDKSLTYNPHQITLVGGDTTATIQADYVVN